MPSAFANCHSERTSSWPLKPLNCSANIRLRLQLSSLYGAARYTEEETKRAEDLVGLQRAKKILFANVSHELVTPLSLVAGPLDDVLAEMPGGRQRDGLNMARRNVQRLSRLVGMLMDLSSLEAGHMASCFRRVNLGEVTRNVAAMYKQASDAAHLTYIVDCDMENRDVYIDRDKYVRRLSLTETLTTGEDSLHAHRECAALYAERVGSGEDDTDH